MMNRSTDFELARAFVKNHYTLIPSHPNSFLTPQGGILHILDTPGIKMIYGDPCGKGWVLAAIFAGDDHPPNALIFDEDGDLYQATHTGLESSNPIVFEATRQNLKGWILRGPVTAPTPPAPVPQ